VNGSKPRHDRVQPIDVSCPTCNAKAGQRCKPMSLTEPHLRRLQKAGLENARRGRNGESKSVPLRQRSLRAELGLTIVPPSPSTAREPDELPYDVEHECRHGRLPTDKSTPCGCWPQEFGDELQRGRGFYDEPEQ
jgi:hypothetical protein